MIPTVNTYPEKVQEQLQLLRDRSGIYQNANTSHTAATATSSSVSDENTTMKSVPTSVPSTASITNPVNNFDAKAQSNHALFLGEDDFVSNIFY